MSESPRLLPLFGILLPLLGCTEYGYVNEVNRDVFQQVRRNTVDVLLVVDNSCSMADEQDKLASNFDNFIEAFAGDIDVDWQIGAVTTDMADPKHMGRLRGGEDEVILTDAEGRILDRVAWTRDWPLSPGVALQLDPSVLTSTANDSLGAWCPATASFGDGDLGTPGAANPACEGGSSTEDGDDDPEDVGEPRPPRVNDLLITEILPNPEAVDDSLGEWVEITNLSGDDISLDGCSIGDDGRNDFVFPAGLVLLAGEHLVVGRSADPSQNGGAPVEIETGPAMTLANSELFLSASSENSAEQFAELVAVGDQGTGIEMGLEGARSALSEPLVSDENEGFLREEANLSLIFISDENDFSPDPVDDYLRFFKDLKGDAAYRDPGLVTISAVVGKDVPPYDGQPSCASAAGSATYGIRYVDLASRTGGVLESICDEDFAPIAAELGLLASGLDLEFVLSEPAKEETLKVKLYAEQSEESLIRVLEKGTDYAYISSRNAIRFQPDQVPPSETWLVAEYEVQASGGQSSDSEDASSEEGGAR